MSAEPVRRAKTLTAVVLALLCGVPATASAAETHADRKGLTWTSCHPEAGPSFQCATARVPLDYSRPHGQTIAIALTRLPASDPSQRIGSLFLNPGGPGGSGVDYVLGAGPFLYTDEVRARFDLVGFDPRGVIRSTPLRCFGSEAEWPQFPPFAFPLTRAQEQEWIAVDRAIDAACSRRGGPIMNHMSTANAARDLDVLRSLVGDVKLSYAGVSYGSYLGLVYANLFPNRVRALVADGVFDPIAWATGRGAEGFLVPFSTRVRSDAGSQATLNEFFRLCDAAGPRCAFSGDAAERFATLAEQLRREPVEVVYDDGTREIVDYSILIASTLGAMYDSLSWSDFATWLAGVEAVAESARTAARVQRFRYAARPRYLPPQAMVGAPGRIEEEYMNFLEGFPGVACSDTTNPRSYAAWSINGALADARFGYFGRIWTWIGSICAEWPGSDRDRYIGPFTRTTANPVLVVGNRFDPATRYEGAVTAHNLLPRSALLTLEAWGHTSLFLSRCADETIASYLISMATPAPGATCTQDVMPFAGG
jgi:pimeloyl-ACP methyl ester carboxylesterase